MTKTKETLNKILSDIAQIRTRLEQNPNLAEELKNKLNNSEGILEFIDKTKGYDTPAGGPNFPISNSNIFSVKEFIKAWTENKNGQVISYRLQMLWSKIRYFQNLLVFENDDYLEHYGHRLFQVAIIGGVAAVIRHPLPNSKTYDEDRLIVSASPLKMDLNGNIVSARLVPGIWIGPNMIGKPDPIYQRLLSGKREIKWDDPTYMPCFLKWESTGISYLLMLYPFIETIESIFKMLQINIPAGMHRWIVKLNGVTPTQTMREEINQMFYSRYSPVWFKTTDLDYEVTTLPRQSEVPPNEYTRQDAAWFMNLMSYITGEFTNLSEKKERNINAEVTVNTSYFHITQQEFLKEAKLFLKRYNRVFNANATVRLVYDLEEHEDGFDPRDDEAADVDNQSESPID